MVADERSFPAPPARSFPRRLREDDSLGRPRSTAPWRRLGQSKSFETPYRPTQRSVRTYSEHYLFCHFLNSRPGPDILYPARCNPTLRVGQPIAPPPRHFGVSRSGGSNETAPLLQIPPQTCPGARAPAAPRKSVEETGPCRAESPYLFAFRKRPALRSRA